MSEFFLVRDDGFHADDGAAPVVLAPDTDPASLGEHLEAALVAIDFPSMTDGRGFTLARRLRVAGYKGRLRAQGHVIADQFPMARRSGFDEVEIDFALAKRQPWELWKRSSGVAPSYLTRLGRSA